MQNHKHSTRQNNTLLRTNKISLTFTNTTKNHVDKSVRYNKNVVSKVI